MKRLALLALLVVFVFALMAGTVAADGGPIQSAAQQYFSGGTKNIKAADLYANLNDGDPSNDPFLVDIRAPADWANGHIPGTINIVGKELFNPDNLAKLPKDQAIVVNCYSGQTASQVTAALNMMGYDAYNLLYAVPSWGTNDKVTYSFTADQSANYKVSTEPTQLEGNFPAPQPLGNTVEAAAQAYFPGGFKAIKAADLFANLNDGDPSNDPIILDTRSADDYALGHIPGAVNVSAKTLFDAENLAKLPADRQIVPVCYSGQTASQITAALRLLGYDAYNLQFGMPSWAIVEGVSVPVWNVSQSLNQPLEVSAVAAAATTAAPVPATLPTTGAPVLLGLTLAGLGALGAGVAFRRR
jgi:rhodanese-related sulfurtransferase